VAQYGVNPNFGSGPNFGLGLKRQKNKSYAFWERRQLSPLNFLSPELNRNGTRFTTPALVDISMFE